MGQIHPDADSTYFAEHPDERGLFKGFLPDFSVTWAAKRRHFGSEVTAAFLRPERHISEMFGVEREILLIAAPYTKLEPRIFQTAAAILSDLPARGRVDQLFFVLVSPASNLQTLVDQQHAEKAQAQIAVPFAANDCKTTQDAFFVRNRLQQFLFARDLFDSSQPINSDLYFFGRSSLAIELLDGAKAGNNYGLFGLRKMGKTSLIFKLRRALDSDKTTTLEYLDLQDSALYGLRWWQMLDELRVRLQGTSALRHSETPESAARSFRLAVEQLPRNRRVIFALDEIEHIAPGLAMRPHWETDFVELWKTLRAVQNSNRRVSFIVAGVNASVIETPSYAGHDNPLFSMAQVRYLPIFDRAELRHMVRVLGGYMGLRFSEDVYDYLRDRYGGHPLLTRAACSFVHRSTASAKRPVLLSAADLRAHEQRRESELFPFGRHVLSMLQQWYPQEFSMLQYLARGDTQFFTEMSAQYPEYAQHLKAYSLVTDDPPRISIPLLEKFLVRHPNSEVPLAPSAPPLSSGTFVDHLLSLSELRNRLEPRLRTYIKRTLKAHLGPERWIDPILKIIPSKERDKLQGIDRDTILSERLFLLNLITAIEQNWEYFKGLEACPPDRRITRDQFKVLLEYVNAHREDAHAKQLEGAELVAVTLVVDAVERAIAFLLED